MKKQLLCLSAADIHGNKLQYEKIKALVKENDISFVFLCGDLLPKDGGSWSPDNKVRTIGMQEAFIRNYFIPYLRDLGTITTVYAIFGNDDFISNYSLMKKADIPNVFFLDNEVVRMPLEDQELFVAGYPYIGLTPFLHKDWEKWDIDSVDIAHKIYRTEGFSSENGIHVPVDLARYNDGHSTIREDLSHLARQSNPKKTIYIFHEAPYNTPLDMIAPDNKYIKDDQLHIGSVALRNFIEDEQPLVTMHGHIHETFDQSGDYKWQPGSSVSFTASNDFSSNTLSCVLFSLPNPDRVERLLV